MLNNAIDQLQMDVSLYCSYAQQKHLLMVERTFTYHLIWCANAFTAQLHQLKVDVALHANINHLSDTINLFICA